MSGTFYQIVKDLFEGAERRRVAGFTVQQIERTIEQIRQQLEADLARIEIEGQLRLEADRKDRESQQRTAAKRWSSRGGSSAGPDWSGVYVAADRPEIQQLVQLQKDEVRAEAEYVVEMLQLEREKHSPANYLTE